MTFFSCFFVYYDRSGWVCLYPLYIDDAISLEKGRKLGKKFCVTRPDLQLMISVLGKQGYKIIPELDKK